MLKNIDIAANIVYQGLIENKRFHVHFDVDIDGISAGTIMFRYLKEFDANVSFTINSGKVHGISHINSEKFNDIDILIIVDSIDNDYKMYTELKSKGIEIVILDHHEFEEYPIDAVLVSSAKNYPNKYLSGSGVTWKFCRYFDHYYTMKSNEESFNINSNVNYALNYIDLCATGIIGDVSDISENSYENRALCSTGLNSLKNPAIKLIVGSYEFNAQSVIWSISPLINAANRTSNNMLAAEFFLTDDSKQLKSMLKKLKEIKAEQDILVEKAKVDLIPHMTKLNKNSNVLYGFVISNEFAGLIANQISNTYHKPTIIFHSITEGSDALKGSIRGYGLDDFRSLINSTKLAQCFGHPNAAGIQMNKNDLNVLINKLNKKLENTVFKSSVDVDIEIDNVYAVRLSMIEIIKRINLVTGKGFNPITFLLNDVEVDDIKLMQDKHVKFRFNDIDFISWNNPYLYDLLEYEEGFKKTLDVVGEFQINKFAGRTSLQFIINDYRNVSVMPEFLFK